MDIRDTPYNDGNSPVALFDSAMQGIGMAMLVAVGFAIVRLLF